MTEPEETPDDSPEQTPENAAYYAELFRRRDKVVLLALRMAEWFYENRSIRDTPDVKATYDAVDDEFDDAVREYVMYMFRPVPK